MNDIFVSYASKDRPWVLRLVRALERHGWSVWWDRAIPPGKTFAQVIEEALDAARCVIVVWSQASVSSEWVGIEAAEGVRRRILVPVLMDEVRIPLEFSRIQAAKLMDWQDTRSHAEFDRLVQAVTAIIGPPSPPQHEELLISPARQEAPSTRIWQRQRQRACERQHASVQPEPAPREMASKPSRPAHQHRVWWGVGSGLGVLALVLFSLVFRPGANIESTFRNSIGMEFMRIPAGTFQMGSNDPNAYNDEKPVHTVRISKPFYLGKYEVTQGQWEAIMGKNPSQFQGGPKLPVESVSWEDVQEFIRRLNAEEGRKSYRLPTEAEWEYAARAGTMTAYSYGDDARQLEEYAWYQENSGKKTHSVGQKQPNAWGLYDMHGNVGEWVQDWYGPYTTGAVEDPVGPSSGLFRVNRGGS